MKSEDLKKALLTSKMDLYLGRNVECCIWSTALYGAKSWTLRKVDQKYLKSFEMRCWRRIEKIGWTDCVGNEVFYKITQKRNILHTLKRKKDSWIGHILCRNYFLKHIIEGKIKERIEVMGRGGGGRKQLLDDLKEKR
jgi:hypothetical protein